MGGINYNIATKILPTSPLLKSGVFLTQVSSVAGGGDEDAGQGLCRDLFSAYELYYRKRHWAGPSEGGGEEP